MDTAPRRRWFQFSLRSLLIGVTLVCSLGWLAIKFREARLQQQAIEPLQPCLIRYNVDSDADGVRSSSGTPSTADWRSKWLDKNMYATVNEVGVFSDGLDDEDAHRIAVGLPHIKQLSSFGLDRNTARRSFPADAAIRTMTDAGLGQICRCTELEELVLCDSRITDAGLSQLAQLSNLRTLALRDSKITDAGLVHLSKLPKLTFLDLNGNRIGDTGLEHLAELTNLERLDLDNTQLTDAGLANLTRLKKLKRLSLAGVNLTNKSLDVLQELTALEDLTIEGGLLNGPVLPRLVRLKQLQNLRLGRYKFSRVDFVTTTSLPGLEYLNADFSHLDAADLDDLRHRTKLRTP